MTEKSTNPLTTEAAEVIAALLEWVDAVPKETPLPGMPGLDRDWAERILEELRKPPGQRAVVGLVNKLEADANRDRKERRDHMRLKWLERNGYLPKGLVAGDLIGHLLYHRISPTVILDWAFSCKFGPAYWRQPKMESSPDGLWVTCDHIDENGLVFVKYCDRARIDAKMAEEASKTGFFFLTEQEETEIKERVSLSRT